MDPRKIPAILTPPDDIAAPNTTAPQARVLVNAFRTQQRLNGRRVTYYSDAPGEEFEVDLVAVIGKTIREQVDTNGLATRFETRDFLLLTTDLAGESGLITPQAAHKIEEEQDGTVYTYKLLPIGSEPCWRYSDPHRVVVRVHTKLIQRN